MFNVFNYFLLHILLYSIIFLGGGAVIYFFAKYAMKSNLSFSTAFAASALVFSVIIVIELFNDFFATLSN